MTLVSAVRNDGRGERPPQYLSPGLRLPRGELRFLRGLVTRPDLSGPNGEIVRALATSPVALAMSTSALVLCADTNAAAARELLREWLRERTGWRGRLG